MTVILAAAETVTSQGWWEHTASIVVTAAGVIAAIAAAVAGVLKFLPGVKGWWKRRQERHRLERAAALTEITEPIVVRVVEPLIAEVRAQVLEGHERTRISEEKVRSEIVAHTSQERQLVRAVMETAVRVHAMRQSDVDEIRRAMDLDEESWEQARGEIPPGGC